MNPAGARESVRLVLRGDPALFELLRDELVAADREHRSGGGRRRLGAFSVFLKYGPIHGKSRLRHALRSSLLRSPLPRIREFANLAWLRENGFGAPRPIVAGAWIAGVLPRFQFLATEMIEGAVTLRQLLEDGPAELRVPALNEIGRESARLHGQGFVHRDLFPRNLLVTGDAAAPHVYFLDAWRGGPGPGLRGPAYDVASLVLFAPDLLSPGQERALLAAYLRERGRRGGFTAPERFLRAVARERAALVRRALRRRDRGSPLPTPTRCWNPPAGL